MANVKDNGRTVRRALAMAGTAAGLLLAACDASNDTTAAQKAGREAAGRMMSAGEPRATEKLMAEAAAGDTKTLENRLKDLAAKGAGLGDYLLQNAAETDLGAAIKQLQDALKLEIAPATKAGLQVQLAQAQMQLAEVRAAAVPADLLSLNEQAGGILGLAQEVIDLNNQAAMLEKAGQPPSPAAVDKAKTALADRQKALADAQANVRNLQGQMSAKEAQARQIYADTDAAFNAADALKGTASINAANKAMDDRKQAEALMAEVGILAPALAQAQSDQGRAQIALDDAQRTANLASVAYDQAVKAAGAAGDRLKNVRAAVAGILAGNGKDEIGLTARVTKFLDLAAKVEPQVRNALTAADTAAGSFASAGAAYDAYTRDLSRRADQLGWKSDDPLRAAVKDQRPGVIIAWSKSAAEQEAGRLGLAASQTFGVAATVITKAGQANVKTDSKLSGNLGKTFNDLAASRFETASTTARDANSRTGGDLERIRWIGLSLQATAAQGAYLAGNRNALADATKAKADAVRIKPELADQLSWIGQ